MKHVFLTEAGNARENAIFADYLRLLVACDKESVYVR